MDAARRCLIPRRAAAASPPTPPPASTSTRRATVLFFLRVCKLESGMCTGDSLNSSLVAIVAVEPDVLKAWAASEGIQYEDLRQLCADPRARAAVLADMDAIGKEAQLRGFEFAKAVTLVAEPFTLENGLLTPTFKVKRPQAKAYFAKEISDMYAEVREAETPRPKL